MLRQRNIKAEPESAENGGGFSIGLSFLVMARLSSLNIAQEVLTITCP